MPLSSGLRPSFPQLIKQLADDGARVAESELALARSEIGDVIRSYILGIALGAAGIAVMTVAVAILAHAAAIALTSFVASAAYAYLSVGLILAAITFGLLYAAKRSILKKHEPVGLIFKWFSDAPKPP